MGCLPPLRWGSQEPGGKNDWLSVQGVHELYDLEETPVSWKDDTERTNRLVPLVSLKGFTVLKQSEKYI